MRVPTPQQPDDTTKEQKSSGNDHMDKPSGFSVLGWILGGMSLLNLVQDIGRMAVFGKLKVWLDAYELLVKHVGSFLFGWIHYRWLMVSEYEHHILVLAGIFAAAITRAEYRLEQRKEPHRGRFVNFAATCTASLFVWFLIPLSLTILLPDYWGSVVSGMLLLLLAFVWFTNSDSDIRMASGRSVLRELLGVIGVFVVLVALNYSIFRTDGG